MLRGELNEGRFSGLGSKTRTWESRTRVMIAAPLEDSAWLSGLILTTTWHGGRREEGREGRRERGREGRREEEQVERRGKKGKEGERRDSEWKKKERRKNERREKGLEIKERERRRREKRRWSREWKQEEKWGKSGPIGRGIQLIFTGYVYNTTCASFSPNLLHTVPQLYNPNAVCSLWAKDPNSWCHNATLYGLTTSRRYTPDVINYVSTCARDCTDSVANRERECRYVASCDVCNIKLCKSRATFRDHVLKAKPL